MNNKINPESIVSVAKSYKGVKFHHQGRGGYGLDCLGLMINIAKELKLLNKKGALIYELDQTDYCLKVANNKLYEQLSNNLYEVNIDAVQPGDILCFKIQNYVRHIAVYSGFNTIIHTTQETSAVIEHKMHEYWKRKIFSILRFPQLM